MKPFLKWAGGKRQLLSVISENFPEHIDTYYEPFLGGGAVFFYKAFDKCVVNDYNEELINCYKVIKDSQEELIKELDGYENTSEFFYEIRNLDRAENYKKISSIKRAARIIYLNKTCFNGLYRVNSSGYFNVPFGGYKNPTYIDKDNIREISKYLNTANVKIMSGDFSVCLKSCKQGDFVYLDPPYHPLTKTSAFTSYSKDGFTEKDQERLKETLDELNKKNVKWLLSNSCADFIKNLYKDYTIIEISAKRSINSNGEKRGAIKEVLIKNF